MQPVPPADDPSGSATTSFDSAKLMARQTQAHTGSSQPFHPAASSFAASAADTAAAMSSTLKKASHVPHETDSQVEFLQLGS